MAASFQTIDDFETGSFTDWSGDTSSFTISSDTPINGTYSLVADETTNAIYKITKDNYIISPRGESSECATLNFDNGVGWGKGVLFGGEDSNNCYGVAKTSDGGKGNDRYSIIKYNSGVQSFLSYAEGTNKPSSVKVFWDAEGWTDGEETYNLKAIFYSAKDGGGDVYYTINAYDVSYSSGIIGIYMDYRGDTHKFDDLKAYAELSATGTKFQVNIGDAWKEVNAIKLNIGDVWKDVTAAKINIGDAWKTIF